jgi:hypothetical protein
MRMNAPAPGSRIQPSRAASAAADLHGEPRIVTECVMPARFRASLHVSEPASAIGPLIGLQASLVLPGLQARITFRDRPDREDVPFQEVSTIVPLVLPGERLERPLLSTRGAPAPARPTLQLRDFNRQPLVPPQAIDYVNGTRPIDVPMLLDVSAVVWLSPQPASHLGGTRLRVNGRLVFPRGVCVRIDPGAGAERQGRPATDLPLVSPGAMFFFYERSAESELAGDPWVSMRFLDERGTPIGDEHPVGLYHG